MAGLGSLGSVLTTHFYQSGHDVRLLLKNERQLNTYHHTGLIVNNGVSTLCCHPPAINIEHVNNPIHYLVCCVKAYDILSLLTHLKPQLNKQSIVILIHNGLGVLDEIKTQLPELRLIAGVCTLGAYFEKPFTVKAFMDGFVYLGGIAGHFSDNDIKDICTTFQDATLPVQWEENIEEKMWEKFALNCSVNLLTALLSCKNGDLLKESEPLQKITHEIAQVMSAYGHPLSSNDLFIKISELLNRVGDNYSSMYIDVQKNRPTELAYLNEQLIKLAQEKKIPTPFNHALVSEFNTRFPLLSGSP